MVGHIDGCLFWVVDISLPPTGERWVDQQPIALLGPSVGWNTQYPVILLGALASLVLKLRAAYIPSEAIFVLFEVNDAEDGSLL